LPLQNPGRFNPDQGLIGVLRKQLPQHGYTTISIQMPVLGFEGRGNQYFPLYPEAAARIKEAVRFLQDKGYKKIAIISHSVGSPMTLAYLKDNANAVVTAWVSIGMPAASFEGTALPIYDLYGENDIPPVLNTARKRAGTLSNSKSIQTVAPNSDHFFSGHENGLVNYVKDYLDRSL
jgi:pimeloyl-ACP methyl ester carboxylesterase